MERADRDLGFLLKYENVAWYEDGVVRILDRRIYPVRVEYVSCRSHEEVAGAIRDMVTQSGGPFVAAAMGMALAACEAGDLRGEALIGYMEDAACTLSHARPTTAAHMSLVTDGALKLVRKGAGLGRCGGELVEDLREYALAYLENTYRKYSRVAGYLADLVPDGGSVLTQCFGETIVGTFIRECHERGNDIRMICAETRPYFQGARLTASVAHDMGVDVRVISDNMPGFVIKSEGVDIFTSAADIITGDGHVVNKIGTFQIALCAKYHGVPYFVTGEISPSHPTIESVEIEYRDGEQVLEAMGTRITMEGVRGLYPAFDITPPELVTGIVTERGVLRPQARAGGRCQASLSGS